MEQDNFTSTEIRRIFRLDEKLTARQTLFNAESRDEIPRSTRMARGKTQVRQWSINQLPEIGKRFGFLEKPTSQKAVCIFTQKAELLNPPSLMPRRATAINGIKTIVVGLDRHPLPTCYYLSWSEPYRAFCGKEPARPFHIFMKTLGSLMLSKTDSRR